MGKVLLVQTGLAVALVVGVLVWSRPSSALAAAFGAVLGILGTVVTGRSVRRSSEAAVVRPGYALVPVFSGVLQKLLIVGAGITLGYLLFGLSPVYTLSGLGLMQLGFLIAAMSPPGGNI